MIQSDKGQIDDNGCLPCITAEESPGDIVVL